MSDAPECLLERILSYLTIHVSYNLVGWVRGCEGGGSGWGAGGGGG